MKGRQILGEAETNKMEVKQVKNLGYEGEKKAPKKPTIPLCRGRASQRKWQKPTVIQKRTKYIPQGTISVLQRGDGQKSP